VVSRVQTLKRRGVLLFLIGLALFVVSGLAYAIVNGTEPVLPRAFIIAQAALNLAGIVLVVIGIVIAVVGFASRRE
jgi:hypothetical protein